MRLIIFDFILKKAQVDAIYTLQVFYKQRYLLFFAKTKFKKSLIFQLLSFLFNTTKVVIIFISFKLFYTK